MNFGYLWSNLKFNAGNSAASMISGGLNWRIRKDTSPIVYKNNRYKSVLVHAAKQLLMSELEGEVNKLIPKFRKTYEKSLRETVLAQQSLNYEQLIANQNNQGEDWGSITATGTNYQIVAKDKYGTKVKEALMLYYDDEEQHMVTDTILNSKNTYNTTTVCHIDLAPEVSMNSSKNIVMTQVQGRDYTRKELVSGGDLEFTVDGSIVSDEMGVYPTEAVKKFIQIMEYNGILNIKFMMLEPFNVTRVIVKNYSLSAPTYKNIQPYSFSCVAVEPDEEVKVTKDTISTVNKQLYISPMNQWYSLILENKLASITANAVADTAASVVKTTASTALDELVTNI